MNRERISWKLLLGLGLAVLVAGVAFIPSVASAEQEAVGNDPEERRAAPRVRRRGPRTRRVPCHARVPRVAEPWREIHRDDYLSPELVLPGDGALVAPDRERAEDKDDGE